LTTLFISDLHLDAASPGIAQQFLSFLETEAQTADALYILGDLFESWVGDDDPNPHYKTIKVALRKLADKRVPVFFMHGNRDFMIGSRFARETGVQILDDPHVLHLNGEAVLLSHGDSWCTDDVEYQAVRRMTRDPQWQAMMLKKTLEERLAFAAQARAASMQHAGQLTEKIADVNAAAVANAMREAGVQKLLHGHTHRPDMHTFSLDDKTAIRIVLGDWYEQGSVVRWDEDGPVLSVLARKQY
jgi:UDP-2,3-diacylglucosamine hydrolase